MDILQQSALAWKELTEYRYQFVYGYKKTLYPINLTFSFEDYPHLAGFQYLKDISLPNYTSAKIVDRILEGKITFEQKSTTPVQALKHCARLLRRRSQHLPFALAPAGAKAGYESLFVSILHIIE